MKPHHGMAGKLGLLFILILGLWPTSSAAADCRGSSLYIQSPAAWTAVNVLLGGSFKPVTAKVNGWYKIVLADQNPITTFMITNSTDYGTMKDIGLVTFNAANLHNNGATENFTCAIFGTGTEAYISEDLANPGKTSILTSPPNTNYLYFLPPDDAEWFQGSPLMIVDGKDTVKMTPDPVRCGWFSTLFFNVDPPTSVVFALDAAPGSFQVAASGSIDPSVDPVVGLNIKKAFDDQAAGGNTMYLVGEDGENGFTPTDPGEVRSCSYDMAAIIYDTDASLHGGFTCQNYDVDKDGPLYTSACDIPGVTYHYPANSKNIPCIGVTKGIVESKLNAATRKPVYSPTKSCFESADKFNQLFNETPKVNTKLCRNMSFGRAADGLWEYDSYNEKTRSYAPVDDEVIATDIGAIKRTGYGAIDLGTGNQGTNPNYKLAGWGSINPATGVPWFDTYPTKNGEFDTGTDPDVYNNNGWGACAAGVQPTADKPCRIQGQHNQHFCFESHADFVYRQGQKFYFRGDDDIWVYINDSLVVDLGGTHLAAPSAVNLDDLGLTPGTPFKIDIFFCDRRTDMSNVRIKTNMYLEQTKSLYTDNVNGTYTINKNVCGGSSCDAIVSGGGCKVTPGSDPSLTLTFTLLNSRKQVVDGDPSTPALDSNLVMGLLYGGITASKGSIQLDTNKFVGLAPGRYQIVIRDANDPGSKTIIKFKVAGLTTFFGVNGISCLQGPSCLTALEANPAANVLAGRLVPFEVAKGTVDGIDSAAVSFALTIPNGLVVYKDSLRTTSVKSGESITTDTTGWIKLWATSTQSIDKDTATFALTLAGSKSKPLMLRFHMPRIAFVADTLGMVKDTLTAPMPQLGGKLNFSFMNHPVYMIAFDPADGSFCADCNDTLAIDYSVTTDSISFSSANGDNVLLLVNGRAIIMVRGLTKISNGTFTVQVKTPADSIKTLMKNTWSPVNLEPPPVPFPTMAAMFDRNSDGRADSVWIRYDRSISSSLDSMPDFIVVRWPAIAPDTTIYVGRGEPTPLIAKTDGAPTARDSILLKMYPTIRSNDVQNFVRDGGLAVGLPFVYENVNTKSLGESDTWFTFVKDGQSFQIPMTISLQDSMPPVVARARVKIGNTAVINQYDTVIVALSEPVDTVGLDQTPFEFKMLSSPLGSEPREVPSFTFSWKSKLDTAILLFDINSDHPHVGDSIRISTQGPIMKDINGNLRSSKAPWVLLEGSRRAEVTTITFVKYNPATMEDRKTKNPVFVSKVNMYANLNDINKALFTENNGPVLGHVIRTDLSEIFSKYATQYEVKTKLKLSPDSVVLHYETTYSTNLGGAVAHGSGAVSCGDAIFEKDCTGSGNGFVFVGWNLTSDEHRLVSSGAYISQIRTWVTIPTLGKIKDFSLDKREIWGVMRSKGEGLMK